MRVLGVAVTFLLWGQLFAADTGNEVTDAADDICPKPPMIANGYVEHAVRYGCQEFYRLRSEGDGVYTLDGEKRWVNKVVGEKLPECEAVCGKPKNPVTQVQRILGGSVDAKGSFPWQAKMISPNNLTSGATLIHEQWLLTTAKNLLLGQPEGVEAKDIGPTLRLYLGRQQQVQVEKVVLHPNLTNVDIGLIKLKEKVPVNERVMPICLPSEDYTQVGRLGYVSGWGRNTNFRFTEQLKYVTLPVADQKNCVEHYEGSVEPEKKVAKSPVGVQPTLNEYTFCAGLSRYQEDTCYGDAGSAFAVHDLEKDTWYAAGILSFDKSCGVAEYGVYTKVSSFLNWIRETMAEA